MRKNYLVHTLIILILFSVRAYGSQIKNLRCEYLISPIGIDEMEPRFTWEFNNKITEQIAYQISVSTSPELLKMGKADMWRSVWMKNNQTSVVYRGKKLLPHTRYYFKVSVKAANKKEIIHSETETFETAKITVSDWKAAWITDDYDKTFEPAPLFRKNFDVPARVKEARVYISGLGYYELFLNGVRVGKNYLDPGYTHFDKRVLYSTYDITGLLKKGANTVSVVLGNGWFNEQSVAVWNFHKAEWRKRPQLLCELRILDIDGKEYTVKTDQTWKTNTGANIYNNIYSGDIIDARLEEEGWKLSSFDDSHWKTAKITDAPSPILQSQTMPAIQASRAIKPVALTMYSDSLYVFDMGENFAGLCQLKVRGERGTVIRMKHGELLKGNGRLEQGNINVYYKPVQSKEVFQTDIYTLKGNGEELFTPAFSYHGFRYVEIESSKPIKLEKDNLTGLFLHTNLKQIGSFSCSDETLNKLWQATIQSYKSNIHSIPTDCPQREKNGWTADAHVAMDLALLNFDAITFYEKWMNDFVDNQRPDGSISGIVPSAGWGYGEWPGPVWDAALFIVPSALYNYYGDSRIIERLYPVFEKYLTYLGNKEKEEMVTFGIGDWVFYKTKTPTEFTSMCYYYLDNKLMTDFSQILHKNETKYSIKAEELKRIINNKFFDKETGIYANGSQAAQAIALYLGLVPETYEQKVADRLVKMIRDNSHFLDFGLLGSKTVLRMLTKYGYAEDAYKMIVKDKAPSWGYWIKTKEYTTLPETWEMSPKFFDASLNHVFLGDVSAWMVNDITGINFDPEQPGFRNIIIRPHFLKELQWARSSYHSINGLISTEWRRSGNTIKFEVSIPGNCTASVYLDKMIHLKAGSHVFVLNE